MNSFPKISIVTPSYNQGQFLEDTILSILNQDYPNLEYFIFDGGSTDNSISIIKKYENRINFWVSEKDNGQSDAINKGLEKSTGEILTWINSDDQLLTGTLDKVASIYNEKKFDLLVGNVLEVNENGQYLYDFKGSLGKPYNPFTWKIAQPGSFFSSRAFKKFGPFDTKMNYAFDMDFWIKIRLKSKKVYYVDQNFALFRRHSLAKSSIGNEIFRLELLRKYLHIFEIKDYSNFSKEQLRGLIATFSYKLLIENRDKIKLHDLFKTSKIIYASVIGKFYLHNITGYIKRLLRT